MSGAWRILFAPTPTAHAMHTGPCGTTCGVPPASATAMGFLLTARRNITIVFGGTPRVAATPCSLTSWLTILGWPLPLAWRWELVGRRRRSDAKRSASLDCAMVRPRCRCCARHLVGLPRTCPVAGSAHSWSVMSTAALCGGLGSGFGIPRSPPTAPHRPVVVPRGANCVPRWRLLRAVPLAPRAVVPTGSPALPVVPPRDVPPDLWLDPAGR